MVQVHLGPPTLHSDSCQSRGGGITLGSERVGPIIPLLPSLLRAFLPSFLRLPHGQRSGRATTGKPVESNVIRIVAVGVVVLTVIVCMVLFFGTEVCHTKTTAADVTRSCRRMTVSDPPIVVLGLLALLALSTFFQEISGFGFTLKRQVEQAVTESGQALEKAAAAVERSDDAARRSDRATTSSEAARAESLASRRVLEAAERLALVAAVPDPAAGTASLTTVEELVRRYGRLRAELPEGPKRTAVLDEIVTQMIVATLQQGFDPQAYLDDADEGLRVAAYAALFARPEAVAEQLLDAAIDEPEEFGQFWALRAVRAAVRAGVLTLDADRLAELRSLQQDPGRIRPDGARYLEIERLLTESQPPG